MNNIKPVKAWAVINREGKINCVYFNKDAVWSGPKGFKNIRVEIRPIPKRSVKK